MMGSKDCAVVTTGKPTYFKRNEPNSKDLWSKASQTPLKCRSLLSLESLSFVRLRFPEIIPANCKDSMGHSSSFDEL